MTTIPIAPSYCRRIGAGILLVALTDFLFYGQPAGISVFLFGMVLAGAVVAMHPAALSDGRVWPGPAALFAGLLPLIENVSPRSVLIAVRVPQAVTDVEEYLVSGITPDAVRWVPHA